MKHNDLNITPTVTPEMAVQMYQQRTTGDLDIVRAIYNEFCKQYYHLYTDGGKKDLYYFSMCALACVWNAGRVEGIRMERKRRKKHSMQACDVDEAKTETEAQTNVVNQEEVMHYTVQGTVSDYKWQLDALRDRLQNPEKYMVDEDVPIVIENLQKWLTGYENAYPNDPEVIKEKARMEYGRTKNVCENDN